MNAKRLWQIGGFLVIVAILALGWFVIVSPGLKTVDENDSQKSSVDARNAQIRADIANLSKVDVGELEQRLSTSIAQIPGTLVEEDVFAEIKNDAAAVGVTVSSISITQPAPFATTQQSAVDTKPTASPSDSGAPAPLVVPGLPIEPSDLKAANSAGMYYSPVAITVTGGFANVRQFIDVLTQQSPRTFLVPTASLDAAGGSMNISAVIWFKPRSEDLLAEPEPAPASTPTPSATPSSTPSGTASGTPDPGSTSGAP